MKILKDTEIEVNNLDDFLYDFLLDLFKNIKLVQGPTALDWTLRRHPRLKNYAVAKQRSQISDYEDNYFNDDGSLNSISIEFYHSSRQN